MAMFGRSSNGKDMTEIPRSDIWGHEAGVSNKKMLHDWFYTRMYVLYCSGLHCIAWHCIAWHCVVVLYCITMQCNAMYCMYVRLHMFVSHLSPQRIPRKLHLIILLVLYMHIYIYICFFPKQLLNKHCLVIYITQGLILINFIWSNCRLLYSADISTEKT